MGTASNYLQVFTVNWKPEEMTRTKQNAIKKGRQHKEGSIITTRNTSKDDGKGYDEKQDKQGVKITLLTE
jgi:hypothetical protein